MVGEKRMRPKAAEIMMFSFHTLTNSLIDCHLVGRGGAEGGGGIGRPWRARPAILPCGRCAAGGAQALGT